MASVFEPEFEIFRNEKIQRRIEDKDFQRLSSTWLQESVNHNYSYSFDWLGVPIIQLPTDLVAFQEIVYSTKPSVIIECGVARGGSLIFWASMQQISDITPKVIGIDIRINPHTTAAIESSSYKSNIQLLERDSINAETLKLVESLLSAQDRVMVVLDSNHTHDHVLKELELYASLVTLGCFLVVLDTIIEELPKVTAREWGPGNSPQTAVLQYMRSNDNFVNFNDLEKKIGFTVAPQGYWQRIK